MELTDDKSRLRLTVDAALNAAEVERLIANLAQLRAGMLPGVQQPLPEPSEDVAPAPGVLAQNDPYVSLKPLRGGAVRLYARSDGLGWLAFDLPERTARSMRDYLQSIVPERSLAGDLINRKFLY